MTQQQVLMELTGLPVVKSTSMKAHAKAIVDIYNFLEKEKPRVLQVVTEPAELNFGKRIDRTWEKIDYDPIEGVRFGWVEKVRNEGSPMPGEMFTVQTGKGSYKVIIPTGNKIHEQFCKLLNVQKEFAREPGDRILWACIMPSGILDAMRKGMNFTSTDSLRPVLQTILLEIVDKKARIVSTDAHQLYWSQWFTVGAPIGTRKYIIPRSEMPSVPKTKEESFQMHILRGHKLQFLGLKIKLFTEASYVDYEPCIPNYDKEMIFSRQKFLECVNQVLPATNRTTNMIKLDITDQIRFVAEDVDFATEHVCSMPYASKTLTDSLVAFNGKFLNAVLNTFKTGYCKMLHNGQSSKPAIFTDGLDSVLLMPLRMAEDWEKKDELTEKTVKIFSDYTCYLLNNFKDIYVHKYDNQIVIRYFGFKCGKLLRGYRKVNLTADNANPLTNKLAEIMEQHGKQITYK